MSSEGSILSYVHCIQLYMIENIISLSVIFGSKRSSRSHIHREHSESNQSNKIRVSFTVSFMLHAFICWAAYTNLWSACFMSFQTWNEFWCTCDIVIIAVECGPRQPQLPTPQDIMRIFIVSFLMVLPLVQCLGELILFVSVWSLKTIFIIKWKKING